MPQIPLKPYNNSINFTISVGILNLLEIPSINNWNDMFQDVLKNEKHCPSCNKLTISIERDKCSH